MTEHPIIIDEEFITTIERVFEAALAIASYVYEENGEESGREFTRIVELGHPGIRCEAYWQEGCMGHYDQMQAEVDVHWNDVQQWLVDEQIARAKLRGRISLANREREAAAQLHKQVAETQAAERLRALELEQLRVLKIKYPEAL